MFDFHIHLARLPHKKQLTTLLLYHNYDFIAVACEPWEWKEINLLKKEFSSGLKPFKVAYGIHPMIATQVSDGMLAKLRTLLEEDKHAMVGEAGIDKRYPGYEDGTQDKVFLEQAKLALEFKRHLQIHCVGDYMRVLKLLEKAGFKATQETSRPIFHRFGGDPAFVKKALAFGALFSLHTDSFRKKSTAAAIPIIPESNLFFETDADETFAINHTDVEINRRTQSDRGGKEDKKGDPRLHGDDKYNENVAADNATSTPSATACNQPNDSQIQASDKLEEKKNPEQSTDTDTVVAEIVAKLESRLESVRAAYAKCRE